MILNQDSITMLKIPYIPGPHEVGNGQMVYLENPVNKLNICQLLVLGNSFEVIDLDYVLNGKN
jgi:hypothetical protein